MKKNTQKYEIKNCKEYINKLYLFIYAQTN